MKRIYLVVRTSYDVFMKPTYALLRKERTDILRLIVRPFFMKLAPDTINLLENEIFCLIDCVDHSMFTVPTSQSMENIL